MASLRLTFPEKDEPTVISLTGARLTIGRLPFNTIQIIDRTVSGFHAELINEHGHYRLHDRGSSNGTFVNGQKVADFHLSESCTITFGTVEAQFSPEDVAANEEAESFPTRTEINAVRKENAELKATVEALREETNALRLVRPMENAEGGLVVAKEEFDKVVVEREALKEARIKQDEEIARLKTDLAVLKRDRVNLQLALDSLQREITEVRSATGGGQENAITPQAAAAALASQSPSVDEEIRVEVPRAPVPAAEDAAPFEEAPVEEPAQEFAAEAEPVPAPVPVPVAVPKPMPVPAQPRTPVAAPMAKPPAPMKPFAPLPKAPVAAPKPAGTPTVVARPVAAPAAQAPSAQPTVTARPVPGGTPKAPAGLGGSGIRPMARPPIAPSTPADAGSGIRTLPNAPTTRLAPRATPPGNPPPPQPTVKMAPMPKPVPKVGPKGTQKLTP